MIPVGQRKQNLPLLRLYDEPSLEEIKNDILACNAISKELEDQDKLWNAVALRACLKSLGREKDSDYDIDNDDALKIFQRDIYIYLKAWLMLSIRHRRGMPVEEIKRRYPTPISPDKYAYVRALRYVRDYLIDSQKLNEYLQHVYRDRARKIIKEYLTDLIEGLEKMP